MNKKNIRRRSNWYIYLITFVITGVVVYFVSTTLLNNFYESQRVNRPVNSNTNSAMFVPDSSYNFNMLFMLNGAKSNAPEYFMTLSYVAQENTFYLIPFPKGTLIGNDSLGEIYANSGEEGVTSALAKELQIDMTKYVRFTKATLPELLNSVGNTLVDVPKNIRYEDADDRTLTIINSGRQNFTGSQLYSYLTLPDYGETDPMYPIKVHALCFTNCVNQNLHNSSEKFFDEYVQYVVQYCSTNITFDEYVAKKRALIYSLNYSSEPADFYIPYGESSGTLFSMDQQSVDSIRRMLRVVEDDNQQ